MNFSKIVLLAALSINVYSSAYAADKKDAAAATPTEAPKLPNITCTSEFSYKWKRIPPPPPPELAGGKKGKPAALPTPDPDLYQPIESPAISIKESGTIEDEVKARVQAAVNDTTIQAMKICVDLHQNLGTCLSKKLGAVSVQLDRMDFDTKRAIREQSLEDCKKEQGICLSTSKTEITCRQEIVPTPAPTEAAKDPKKK